MNQIWFLGLNSRVKEERQRGPILQVLKVIAEPGEIVKWDVCVYIWLDDDINPTGGRLNSIHQKTLFTDVAIFFIFGFTSFLETIGPCQFKCSMRYRGNYWNRLKRIPIGRTEKKDDNRKWRMVWCGVWCGVDLRQRPERPETLTEWLTDTKLFVFLTEPTFLLSSHLSG